MELQSAVYSQSPEARLFIAAPVASVIRLKDRSLVSWLPSITLCLQWNYQRLSKRKRSHTLLE